MEDILFIRVIPSSISLVCHKFSRNIFSSLFSILVAAVSDVFYLLIIFQSFFLMFLAVILFSILSWIFFLYLFTADSKQTWMLTGVLQFSFTSELNIWQNFMCWYLWPKQLKLWWNLLSAVGSIVVVSALVDDLKAPPPPQMNVQHKLIRELMLYELKLGHYAAEATSKHLRRHRRGCKCSWAHSWN